MSCVPLGDPEIEALQRTRQNEEPLEGQIQRHRKIHRQDPIEGRSEGQSEARSQDPIEEGQGEGETHRCDHKEGQEERPARLMR